MACPSLDPGSLCQVAVCVLCFLPLLRRISLIVKVCKCCVALFPTVASLPTVASSWECVSEFCIQGTKHVLGILMQFQIKMKKRCELQLKRLFQGVSIFFFFPGWIRKLSSLGRQHFRGWCHLVPATDERQMVIFLRIHK